MRGFLRGQFRIADLLVIIFVVAAWTGFEINRIRMKQLQVQIQAMQRTVGELVIDDPSMYNVIGQTVIRYPDEAWQISLPKDRTYRLNLVTRGIQETGFPKNETMQVTALTSGTHRIYMRQTHDEQGQPQIQVLVDDIVLMDAHETKEWEDNGGSSSTGVGKSQTTATLVQPLVLKRLRANDKQPNGSSLAPPRDKPANGILLWIES